MDEQSDVPVRASFVQSIVEILRSKHWMLGTAESCTGGWIGKTITDMPGVSDVFAGGVITYSAQMKCILLGVDEKTISNYGEVSRETALEMVSGLVNRYGIDVGIAVTGIAGPGGGSEAKPVGLVYIATQVHENPKVGEYHFSSDRETIRTQSCSSALKQTVTHLIEFLNKPLD